MKNGVNIAAKRATTQPSVCFVALILLPLLSACGGKAAVSPEDQQAQAFADLRQSVSDVIPAGDRRDQALALVGDMEAAVAGFTVTTAERRSELLRLYVDYDTSRDDLATFVRLIDEELAEDRKRAFDLLQRLGATATPDEQKAILKAETRAMKAIARSLSDI